MPVKYRVAVIPKIAGRNPNWSKPLDLMPARDTTVNKLKPHKGKGFKMRLRGEDAWGPEKSLPEVREVLPARFTTRLHVGDVWVVKSLDDDTIVHTRKVEVEPPTAQTPGTDAIDKILTWLNANYKGKWENWGICNCRRISGSSEWSQHAYCNGFDINATTAMMDTISRAAVNAARAGNLPAAQVIWRGREQINGGSVYDHFDHIHFSGAPMRSGFPLCA